MAQKPQLVHVVREIRFVFATEPGNAIPTEGHIMEQFTRGCDRTKNAVVGFALFDPETGRRLRRVEFGEITPETKRIMDVEFATDEAVGA